MVKMEHYGFQIKFGRKPEMSPQTGNLTPDLKLSTQKGPKTVKR